MADPFRDMFELYRIVVIVCVTEDGLYWKDQVPDALASSYIEVEYPVRVIMSDDAGAQHYLKFAAPQATDKDKKVGCVISYNGQVLSTITGEVSVAIEAERIVSTEFNAEGKQCATIIHNLNVEESMKLGG